MGSLEHLPGEDELHCTSRFNISAEKALAKLAFSRRRIASDVRKVLQSAIANASQDENVNLNSLYVADCRADDGPMLNNRLRWRPGPQGRAMPFAKKTSHLTILVSEREAVAEVEETKPKAKPKAKKEEPKAKGPLDEKFKGKKRFFL